MNYQASKNQPKIDRRKLKGEATRERLIIEAIRLFGQRGYDGTNTRALAEAAQCNLGLITFHFGGKLGLYSIAMTRVKNRLNELINPTILSLDKSTSDENLSKKELYEIIKKSIENLSLQLVGLEQLAGHALLLLRDLQDKSDDSNITYKTVFLPLVTSLEKAIDKATSYKDPSHARLSAFMVVNASIEFLRSYPIFYPETQDITIPTPTMPHVVHLLTSCLLTDHDEPK